MSYFALKLSPNCHGLIVHERRKMERVRKTVIMTLMLLVLVENVHYSEFITWLLKLWHFSTCINLEKSIFSPGNRFFLKHEVMR